MIRKRARDTFKKFAKPFPKVISQNRLDDLLKVYEDLERTLKQMKKSAGLEGGAHSIDIRKLVNQLTVSKRRIERKISNAVLLEKQNLKKKIGGWAGWQKEN